MKRFKFLVLLGLVLTMFFLFNPGEAYAARWIKPTGFNDPSNAWSYEQRAYDNSTSTYAYTSSSYRNTWTPFVEYTSGTIPCDKIRFYQGIATYYTSIDIDVFNNNTQQWADVYEGSFTAGSWIEKSIPGGTVQITKARVRLKVGATSYKGRLYEFEFWCSGDLPEPPPGWQADFWQYYPGIDQAAYRDKVVLSWVPAENATGYRVYNYNTGALMADVSDTNYTISGLACRVSTEYAHPGVEIAAYNACGEERRIYRETGLATLYCEGSSFFSDKVLFQHHNSAGDPNVIHKWGDYIFQSQNNELSWYIRKIRRSDGIVDFIFPFEGQGYWSSIWWADFASDSDTLWASIDSWLVKIDPNTAEVLLFFVENNDIPYRASILEYDSNGNLWTINDEDLYKLNGDTGEVLDTYTLFGYTWWGEDYNDGLGQMFFDGQYLWVMGRYHLHKVDINTGADLGVIENPTPGSYGWWLTHWPVDEEVMWLVDGDIYVSYVEDSGPLYMYKIDRSSLAILQSWQILSEDELKGVSTDIVFDGTYWYVESGTGYRVFDQDFNELGGPVRLATSYIKDMLFDGSHIWAGGYWDGEFKVEPGPGEPENNPPNIPALVAPPHNTWINYNPTFTATVSDSDGGNVRAYFSAPADNWGGWVASGGNSTYGPVTVSDTSGTSWQAYAQDPDGATSSWSGWWTLKKDTVAPVVSVSSSTPTSDTARWDWDGTTDALSGLRTSNTFYRDVDANLAAQGYSDGWTTSTFLNTGSLPDGTYQLRITAYDNAGNSATSDWVPVTIQTTGTISGYVWDDTTTPTGCTFDPAQDSKMGGREITATNRDTFETHTTTTSLDPLTLGEYSLSSLDAGDYDVCVEPSAEWEKICPTTDHPLCELAVTLSVGETETVNFGLKYAIDGWYQGIGADVHTNSGITISVPVGEYFVTGSGVVTAGSSISNLPGSTAESTWMIENYSNIDWPGFIDSMTAADEDVTGTVRVKYYEEDPLVISTSHPDWSTYFNSSSPTIIVAENITIAGDVGDDPPGNTNKVEAILIAKNTLTVDDSIGNKVFNLKGSVFARTVVVNRELNNNSFPAMRVELDPRYFVYDVPYFTRAGYTWKEAK